MFYVYMSNRAFVAFFCLKNIFDQEKNSIYVIKTNSLNFQKGFLSIIKLGIVANVYVKEKYLFES